MSNNILLMKFSLLKEEILNDTYMDLSIFDFPSLDQIGQSLLSS